MKGRTVMERKFMKGNEAIAEAAVRAGCRFYAGYPITPQSEVPEYLSRALPKAGGIFVQGESEVASINMVYGAAAGGTLAMTSTSGPGNQPDGRGNLIPGSCQGAVGDCGHHESRPRNRGYEAGPVRLFPD